MANPIVKLRRLKLSEYKIEYIFGSILNNSRLGNFEQSNSLNRRENYQIIYIFLKLKLRYLIIK